MPCKPPPSYSSAVVSALVMLLAAVSAGAAPGDFDPTFAGDGIIDDASESQGTGIALQDDGKILVTVGSGFGLLRYDETGSLDAGFSTAGRASASFAVAWSPRRRS